MGFLTILRKQRQKEKEMRLLLLGLDNAGKTTILKRICGEDIHTISPTLGFNIRTLEYKNYKLNIWDVGGQKSIRTYWRNYFEQTDAIIWVVDSVDKRRIRDCKMELDKLLMEERLAGASLLIFANKQDLSGALTADQIAEALEVEKMETHHCKVIPCSAVTGENLINGMEWVVADVAARIFAMD